MKFKKSLFVLWSLIASLCLSARATTMAPAAQVEKENETATALERMQLNNINEEQLLRQAYGILESADHDYKGHRARAMKQIEEAGHDLGLNVKGDGKGHEKQTLSDAQLHEAEGYLQQVRTSLAERGQKKALGHVNNALGQLAIALKIR